ncbi:2-amino-4-hydroxy-6-hydroxymethyldihydropteridine diphosphokinase, partial [bacterium]
MIERVYIAIGSNLGDRRANCTQAIANISRIPSVRVVKISSLYETEPWGVRDQPNFINCAVEAETSCDPRTLMSILKNIEADMGRKDGPKWGPRVIDFDIIFYGSRIIKEDDLVIPHPHAHERSFVLTPLIEIEPGLMHPILKKTVSELVSRMG